MLRSMGMIMGSMTKPDELKDFARHLEKIIFDREEGVPNVRHHFYEAVTAKPLNHHQYNMLREYSSLSVGNIDDGETIPLWYAFKDGIGKRISEIPMIDARRRSEVLKDIVIFTEWNIRNFALITGVELQPSGLHYPAVKWELKDFGHALSYLSDTVLPRMKDYLARTERLSPTELEQQLHRRALQIECEQAVGIDIFMPLPEDRWNALSKGP